ncbi:hypothetical protein BH11BAC7_BH11BAC7_27580 [soil metagenome]
MRKLLTAFFLVLSASVIAQESSVKATLSRIFIEIPDSCFSLLTHTLPDSITINKAGRKSLIDTLQVIDTWYPVLHFTSFDTVHRYLWLLAKEGEPEGMTAQIAYWNCTDGTRLVMMTVNYSDICVLEQRARYFWIDNGIQLVPVKEAELFPSISNKKFIKAAFLKKHKTANKNKMPYMLLRGDNENAVSYVPALDYLFACADSFKDNSWYGLERKDFVRDELLLYWNGTRFTARK